MTRLDASHEPSMEDILASIRKIIAEEPPGSRVAPAPALRHVSVQPNAPSSRVFQSEGIADVAMAANGSALNPYAQPASRSFIQPDPSPNGAAPSGLSIDAAASAMPSSAEPRQSEPYLRSTPAAADLSAFKPAPFFPRSMNGAQEARVEPSFASMSAPVAEPAIAAELPPAAVLSVDAQLSDLLSEVLPSTAGPQTAEAPQIYETAAPVSAAVSAFEPADAHEAVASRGDEVTDPVSKADSRPGFTVSRDGYVGAASIVTAQAEPKERDPFDFDLGPSPFAAKIAARSKTVAEVADQLARLSDVPPAPVIVPEALPSATASHGMTDVTEQPIAVATVPYLAPSIAATMAPPSDFVATAPTVQASGVSGASPVSSLAEGSPTSFSDETAPISEDVADGGRTDAALASTPLDTPTATTTPALYSAESSSLPARGDVQSRHSMLTVDSLASATYAQDMAQRSMEDTVADLLRPMLKTWLAENMPKIVERALRREITEQMLSEHKSAAE